VENQRLKIKKKLGFLVLTGGVVKGIVVADLADFVDMAAAEVVFWRFIKRNAPLARGGVRVIDTCYDKHAGSLNKKASPQKIARQECSAEQRLSHIMTRLPSTFLVVMKSLRLGSVTMY
jgi:hypothetical protein